MDDDYRLPEGCRVIIPEPSDWVAVLIKGVEWRPEKGSEPNWFHRQMHRLLLGIRWKRIA